MDSQQLEYLTAVIKHGSFSRAAEVLGRNQSVLSRRIAALEDELGFSLLNRHARGVTPTGAGEELARIARHFAQDIARLIISVRAKDQNLSGTFRLGIPMFLSSSIAPQLMGSVSRAYPGVSLSLREGHSGDVRDWLLAGELNAAVIYESRRPRQLPGDLLFEEPGCVVGSRELAMRHDLRLDNGLSLEELARLPLLLPTRRHGTRLELDAAMKQKKLSARIAHEVDALGTRMILVRKGEGITIFESAGLLQERQDETLFVERIIEPEIVHQLMWVDARKDESTVLWREFARFVKQEIICMRRALDDSGLTRTAFIVSGAESH